MKLKHQMRSIIASVLVLVLLISAGCAQSSTNTTAINGATTTTAKSTATTTAGKTAEKIVQFSRPEDLLTLDPHDHTHISCGIVNRCIYDTLLELKQDSTYGFGLATEYKVSDDGLKITLKLRQGVKFHNGEIFTAESVKVSFDRLLTGSLKFKSNFPTYKSVDIINDYECVFNLSAPSGTVLANMTSYPIIPAKAWKEKGTELFKKPIGSGPFKFVEWLPTQKVTLVKNEEYWGTKANVDKLIYVPLTEASTRVAALKTGEIDAASVIPPDQAKLLASDKNLTVNRTPAWDQCFLMFNCARAPFTDARVREAVALAIDRDLIVSSIVGSRVSNGAVPKGVGGFDESIPTVKQNLERAKQLVKDAGATGKSFVIAYPEGTYTMSTEVLTVISEQVNQTGLKCSFQSYASAAFYELRVAGNYDLFFTGGSSSNGIVGSLLQQRVLDDIHKSSYKNDKLNSIIREGVSTLDSKLRDAKYSEAMKIMNAEFAPWTFLYQSENIDCYRKNISDIWFRGDGWVDLRNVKKES